MALAPTSPSQMASLPLQARHTAHRPHLKGPGGGGIHSLCSCQKGDPGNQSAACLAPLWILPWGWTSSQPPASAPPPPPTAPLANRVGFSWADRVQTADIRKASYFSSKQISPDPEALELPWNIPDLTLPLSSPSVWNLPGPTMLMSVPEEETSPSLQEGGLLTRSQASQGSQEVCSWDWLSNPRWPGLGQRSSLADRHFPALNTHASSSLKQLSCLEQPKKFFFSFWCWLKGNTKHLNKNFQIFLRTELSLCGQGGRD